VVNVHLSTSVGEQAVPIVLHQSETSRPSTVGADNAVHLPSALIWRWTKATVLAFPVDVSDASRSRM